MISKAAGTKIRKQSVISAIATTLLSACTTSPAAYYSEHVRCEPGKGDPAVAEACLQIAKARQYLDRAQRKILDVWKLPRGISADQKVSVMFRLGQDGSIQCLSSTQNLSEKMTRSVMLAFERSTPFGPVPSEAACLSELTVTATFSNPLKMQ